MKLKMVIRINENKKKEWMSNFSNFLSESGIKWFKFEYKIFCCRIPLYALFTNTTFNTFECPNCNYRIPSWSNLCSCLGIVH